MRSANERIPVATATMTEIEAKAVYEQVRSGWVTMGPTVKAFEENFAAYVGAPHAVAMCNGTATLHAILAALGIGPGDEVIVPTLTYIATANVVLYQGAELRLCECDPLTYNVTAEILEAAITSKTKVIITVDMNGLPIDYDPIVALARERGIAIIADSAESLGARYKGRPVGSQAALHSFSFFGNKNVTTGEGGMVTTTDAALANELRILRNQGQQGRYTHTHLGFNYRMTDVAAAIGLAQLTHIEARLAQKQHVADRYRARFAEHPLIHMPGVPAYADRHSWYMFAPSFDQKVDRDAVCRGLDAEGIETRVSFPPVHIQPYYVERFGLSKADFPISHEAWARLINLPIWPGLTDAQIDRVADATMRLAASSVGNLSPNPTASR